MDNTELNKVKDNSSLFPIIIVVVTIIISFCALNMSNDIEVLKEIDKDDNTSLINSIMVKDNISSVENISGNLLRGNIFLNKDNNFISEIDIDVKNNFDYPILFNGIITDIKNIDIYSNSNVIYDVSNNIKDNILNSKDSGIITILFKNKNDLKVDNDLELYFKLDFSDIK